MPALHFSISRPSASEAAADSQPAFSPHRRSGDLKSVTPIVLTTYKILVDALAFFVLQLRAVFHEAETGYGALCQGCAGQAWMDFAHVGLLRLSSHADAARLRLQFAHPSEIFERRRKQLMQLLPSIVGVVTRLLLLDCLDTCCRGVARSVPLILHLPRLLVALACDFIARLDHDRQDLDRLSHPDCSPGVTLIFAASTADKGPDRTLAYHGVAHWTHYRDDVLLAR